jgi:hypothetical protein
MSKFKPYKSYFGETKDVSKKSKNSRILERAVKELYSIKRSLKKLKEEDEIEVTDVEDAIGAVEEVITDVISAVGASDPAVQELIDASAALEMSDESDEEEFEFTEEEDDEEDEEDLEDDDEEEEKKESVKRNRRK